MTDAKQDDSTWHKALCLAFRKLGIVEMLITQEDADQLLQLQPEDLPAMVAVSAEDGIHLVLTTQREARGFQEALKEEQGSSIIVPH